MACSPVQKTINSSQSLLGQNTNAVHFQNTKTTQKIQFYTKLQLYTLTQQRDQEDVPAYEGDTNSTILGNECNIGSRKAMH